MTNSNRILTGNIRKVLLSLALPVILANAIQTLYQVADTYWVSRLTDSDLSVAAVNFVGPLVFVSMAFGIGMNIAGTSIISQFIGMGRGKESRNVAGQLVSFSLVFSLILGLAGAVLGKNILALLGARDMMLEYGWDYLGPVFLGMPTMFVFFAFQSIKQGQGDTFTPMLLSGASVLLNILLDPLFMFVFKMGIAGAAWATVLARALCTIAGMYLLFCTHNGIRLSIKDLRFNGRILKKIVKIGLPAGVGQSIEGLGFMIMNIFVLSFGDFTVTAFGIGNNITSLILLPAMGFGSALAAVVGQNLGAQKVERAIKAVKESMFLSVAILIAGGIGMYFASPAIVGIFSKEPIVLKQGVEYLRLTAIGIPLMGIFQALVGCFQGAGHTFMAMMITSGRLWAVRIPLILLLKHVTPLAEKSVWYAMVSSNLFICIFGLILFAGDRWKQRIVDDKEDYLGELEMA